MKYERVTYEIKYYAELGYCDGGGIGYWTQTKESVAFPTKEEAQKYLDSHPDVHLVTFGSGWTEQRPKWGYGLCRVRRAEEPITPPSPNK